MKSCQSMWWVRCSWWGSGCLKQKSMGFLKTRSNHQPKGQHEPKAYATATFVCQIFVLTESYNRVGRLDGRENGPTKARVDVRSSLSQNLVLGRARGLPADGKKKKKNRKGKSSGSAPRGSDGQAGALGRHQLHDRKARDKKP